VFWFHLLTTELIPLTLLLFGWLFRHRPPRTINSLYGYRTNRSSKNQQTWDFAQRHCGKVWFSLGLLTAPLSALPFLFVAGQPVERAASLSVWLVAVQSALMIGTIFVTESALKRSFDREGRPREGGSGIREP